MRLVPLFCFAWTVAVYVAAKLLYRRYHSIWLSPAVLAPALTVAMMLSAGIKYADYIAGNQWLVWLLGPATVAFAIPIFQYRETIRRHWLALGLGICVGMGVASGSALLFAHLLHFDSQLSRTLMARSISTPFAMAMTSHNGGSPDLVALLTMITGFAGMFTGDIVLAVLKLRSPIAHGAALGVSAHGFGTARARERGAEEGVIASLTMVLSGVLMVLVGPWLTEALYSLLG